jgi:hypothetical protein
VDPRAGLGIMEKRKFLTLLGLQLRPLGHPARSQSLYRLPKYTGKLDCGMKEQQFLLENNLLDAYFKFLFYGEMFGVHSAS